jgi:hypothetical protein
MARPNILTPAEEHVRKMEIIDAIITEGKKTYAEVSRYVSDELKPFQVKHYMTKFGLDFDPSHISKEDMDAYELYAANTLGYIPNQDDNE